MTVLLEATKESTKAHVLKFSGKPQRTKPLSWLAVSATIVGGIAFVPAVMAIATYVWRALCGC